MRTENKKGVHGEGICRLRSDVSHIVRDVVAFAVHADAKINPRLGICQWRGRNPLYA